MPGPWRRQEVKDIETHPLFLTLSPPLSANILLDSHLVPRLSDFGLARECSARSSQQSQFSTQSEVIMGTVAYMAPEFFRNRKFSPKTDVYSFGVVLLELYTGLAADDPAVPQRALVRRGRGRGNLLRLFRMCKFYNNLGGGRFLERNLSFLSPRPCDWLICLRRLPSHQRWRPRLTPTLVGPATWGVACLTSPLSA